jgi:hypothetical protein
MTDTLPDPKILERTRMLQKKRCEILALPPEQALERILSDPHPAALVHSFPETDFYFFVQDIGPEDALPLLALASDRQWDHVVDLETWSSDRIEIKRVTRWMSLFLEADPKRFIRWFLKERLSFGEWYLFHMIEVRIREHDQDPSEFGEDFFTLDNVYYVRFLKTPPPQGESEISEEERTVFLTKFLKRLAENDHLVFQNVLLESAHVIPAETEEELYHWRNVQVAEKGFVPFDEAVGIYQPVTFRQLISPTPKFIPRAPDAETSLLPVPAYPLREMPEGTLFSSALTRIEAGEILTHIEWEFTNLCNQLIVADRKTVRSREQLREIVAKACGYISLGLERLQEEPEAPKAQPDTVSALVRYPLIGLFRLGFGTALNLKWEVERWLNTCWFTKAGLKLSFWGEQWMGVLGGILLKKPQYYDNYKTSRLYREFTSLEDVEQTEKVFRQIQAIDHLLRDMRVRLAPSGQYSFLTWKNLLLTRWAGHRLGVKAETVNPLPLKPFEYFFTELLPDDPASDPSVPRRIPDVMKSDFISWLADGTGLKKYEISEKLAETFEDLFGEIEAEYGRVSGKDLDPRFVHLFLLKKPEKNTLKE